jgi:hypothetical protein
MVELVSGYSAGERWSSVFLLFVIVGFIQLGATGKSWPRRVWEGLAAFYWDFSLNHRFPLWVLVFAALISVALIVLAASAGEDFVVPWTEYLASILLIVLLFTAMVDDTPRLLMSLLCSVLLIPVLVLLFRLGYYEIRAIQRSLRPSTTVAVSAAKKTAGVGEESPFTLPDITYVYVKTTLWFFALSMFRGFLVDVAKVAVYKKISGRHDYFLKGLTVNINKGKNSGPDDEVNA